MTPFLHRLLPLLGLVASVSSTGCFTYKLVGIADQDVAVGRKTPLVCLMPTNGRRGEIIEGELAGKPAVYVTGPAIGFSSTFHEPQDAGGMQMFAGEKCLVRSDGMICDGGVFASKNNFRYFVYWNSIYMSPNLPPATTQELMAAPSKAALLAKLREIDLDDETHAAFVALSDKRSGEGNIRLATFAVGAAAQAAGQVKKNQDLVDAGAKTIAAGQQVSAMVAEGERPIVEGHPKLLPVLEAANMARSFCIARVSPGG